MIALILLIFAFVLAVLAGLGIPSPARFQFLGWALACYFASLLVGRVV